MAEMDDLDNPGDLFSPDDPRAVYAYLPLAELQKQCKEVGLSTQGSKQDLIRRLYSYENDLEASEDEEDPEESKMNAASRNLDLAHKGFSADPLRYERGRPEYDPNIVIFLLAQLGIGPGTDSKRVACDVGAGTGKFTKVLLEHASKDTEVIALEPVENMRSQIMPHPRLRVVAGTAQQLPLRDQSVHCIVVAQAFHWFATTAVLKEFARVLVPHGSIGLICNTRDVSEPWMLELEEYIDRWYGDEPRQKTGEWKNAFQELDEPLFTPLNSSQFAFEQHGTLDTIVDRFLSISAIARRSKEERAEVERTIRSIILRHFPQLAASNPQQPLTLRLPYISHVHWCYKLDPHQHQHQHTHQHGQHGVHQY